MLAPTDLEILLITAFVMVMVTIGIHYEVLRWTSHYVRQLHRIHRMRVALAVLGAFTAHVTEAMAWAVALYLLFRTGHGEVVGAQGSFGDAVYLSFVTYSSLGFGDVVVTGPLRFLAGLEAIIGLLMIAWSASFTYFEMERYWSDV